MIRIGHTLGKIGHRLTRIVRCTFGYYVIDSYGTCIHTWTLARAIEWLAYCGPDGIIIEAMDLGSYTKATKRMVSNMQVTTDYLDSLAGPLSGR